MTVQNTKVIVPCRLSYAHIWEPDSVNGSEPKYSVSCIIDKDDKDTITKIQKAIELAKEEGITDVLFVNNTETISDDAFISKLNEMADK